MKDINLTIKQDILVPFLPTSRHKIEKMKKESVELNIKIKDISDESFPVAFRVTDYESFIENITYEEYQKLTEDEKKQKRDFGPYTEDLRYFKGHLYKPVRVNLYGTLNSTLIETGVTKVNEILNWRKNTYYTYEKEERLFDKDKSIIDFEARTKEINKEYENLSSAAEKYVLYDNYLYEQIGEPYYTTTYFLYDRHDTLFIGYATESDINHQTLDNLRQNKIEKFKFSSLHKENISQHYTINENSKNIEVLMPEVVRFKDFIDLEKERNENLTLTEFLKNKDVENKNIRIAKSPEDANELFKFLIKSLYVTQKDPKDCRVAANKALKLFSEENKTLLSQYFEKNNIKTEEAFDKYFKHIHSSLRQEKQSNFEYTREV